MLDHISTKYTFNTFFNNIFSYSTRKEVCEHAYQLTMKDIKKRKDELLPVLQKHGYSLNEEALNQTEFKLYKEKIGTDRDRFKSAMSKLDAVLETL